MNIGRVASLTGASAKAIRHYEAMRLLGSVQRAGKYRVYSAKDVALIRLIREAQALGFKLSELLVLTQDGGLPSWQKIIELIDTKQQRVVVEIERLNDVNTRLGMLKQEILVCPDIQDDHDLSVIDCDLTPYGSLIKAPYKSSP